jgi:hypothetical protein
MRAGRGRSFASLRMTGLCLCSSALLVAIGCGEKGRPDPSVQMAASHEREASAEGTGTAGSPKVPTRLVVPPEVEKTYSGIRLTWKESSGGKEGMLDVPLGGSARIPDSELDVRADVFLPAFTMAGEEITSQGVEPNNPAARITVAEKGNEVFSGWIFTNFPDVHPFQHPRFSLKLTGGVKKAA